MSGEVETLRLVDLGVDADGEHRGVALARVYEHEGWYAGWTVVDGEYGCANIIASKRDFGDQHGCVAAIRADLERMLAATSRPVLHVDRESRMIERRVTDDKPMLGSIGAEVSRVAVLEVAETPDRSACEAHPASAAEPSTQLEASN